MPFKSKAQKSKFYALKEQGKMSQATIDQWEAETGDQALPERTTWKKIPAGFKPVVKRAMKVKK